MLSRLGEVTSSQDYFIEADREFTEAARLENEFCEETQASHFLTATTLQSHAVVLMNMGNYEAALKNLAKACEIQSAIFKTNVHYDIAKTWHFSGDVHAKKGDYTTAIDAYLTALVIKKQLAYKDDYMVNMTQNALKAALKNISADNDLLAFEQRNKIYGALTDKVKDSFINKDETFTNLIKDEMNVLRDKISRKDNAAGSQNRFHAVPASSGAITIIKGEEKDQLLVRRGLN
jgi:tetratricopeptide (TPR) repeat protein